MTPCVDPMTELYEISGTLSNAPEIPDKPEGLILVAVVFFLFDRVFKITHLIAPEVF